MTLSEVGTARTLAPTDDQVMEQVVAGDADAFGELYDRFSRRAFGLARTVCKNPHQAEDALQEAFLAVWRSRATYRAQRGGVAAWLLTIVRHRAIDTARRNRAVAARSADFDSPDTLPGTVDIAEQTVDRDEFARVRSSLHQISEVQREVVTLAYFGQLTHTEIAAQLDLPVGTVKGRIRLGLKRLRAADGENDGCRPNLTHRRTSP